MRPACAALVLLFASACDTGVTCDTKTADVGAICVPDTLAPGIPAVLDVEELCGPGCSPVPDCSAIFRNGSVFLDVEQDICSDILTATCLSQSCQQRTLHCPIPALAPGDYALVVPGGPPRLLRVQAGGTSTCRFITG